MKTVFFNARFLTQPISGVQNYAATLSLALKKKRPDFVFLTCRNILHSALAAELNAVPVGRFDGPVWEQFELPAYLKKKGSPLLINLCNTAPVSYRNQVNTIHDLAFEQSDAWFTSRFTYYYRWLIPQVARNNKKLLTVSRFTAEEIEKVYGIPSASITIIPNSVSAEFLSLIAADNSLAPEFPYFLAVGTLDPRKNLETICEAFLDLQQPDLRLFIAGRKNENFRNTAIGLMAAKHSGIVWLDDVSNAKLVTLYKHATALINLSLYEGFGLNNLEAMACGCPLLVSDIPVFHEVCGNAACYVVPLNRKQVTEAMRKFLDDPGYTALLRSRCAARSGHYQTETAANRLLDEIISLKG